jgi:hypothetical protein
VARSLSKSTENTRARGDAAAYSLAPEDWPRREPRDERVGLRVRARAALASAGARLLGDIVRTVAGTSQRLDLYATRGGTAFVTFDGTILEAATVLTDCRVVLTTASVTTGDDVGPILQSHAKRVARSCSRRASGGVVTPSEHEDAQVFVAVYRELAPERARRERATRSFALACFAPLALAPIIPLSLMGFRVLWIGLFGGLIALGMFVQLFVPTATVLWRHLRVRGPLGAERGTGPYRVAGAPERAP